MAVTGQQLIDAAMLSTHGHAYIRFRDPVWSNPEAYARLSVLVQDDRRVLGPWLHLFDRRSQEVIGEPTPQVLMLVGSTLFDPGRFRAYEIEPWTGALDRADT